MNHALAQYIDTFYDESLKGSYHPLFNLRLVICNNKQHAQCSMSFGVRESVSKIMRASYEAGFVYFP